MPFVFLLASLVLFAVPSRGEGPARVEHAFHHENILGTSLDLIVVTNDAKSARACESAVLAEIERLRAILSTYDARSEVSRLNLTSNPVACSQELIDVLLAYEHWHAQSHGALNGQLGQLVRTWKEAESRGVLPGDETLRPQVQELNQPAWKVDRVNRTVERLSCQPLNVNAIGKGYILGKATAAGRHKAPDVKGLLLNIGGDVLATGHSAAGQLGWRVGVADPGHPEENSLPLTELQLRDRAVATSAAYERYYTFDGRRFSHIFDPRTGRSAEGVASATVVARDNVTANALATTLCVLRPDEGLALVEATTDAACLLVLPDGKQLRSQRFAAYEVPAVFVSAVDDKESKWPKDFQVTIAVEIIQPTEGKIRRPYAAIWIETADRKPVRMLSVWGNQPQYQRDLTSFWKHAREQRDLVESVTRATRSPGRYTVAWDGRDDKGEPVERGTYTIVVEVCREFGGHVRQIGKLECRDAKAEITLKETAETGATKAVFGPRGS